MKTNRTAPYKFNIEKESPRFKKLYYDELNHLGLAHRIAELREKCGLTQAELARKVGTTQAGSSRLENPNYRNYSLRTLEKVAFGLKGRLKVDFEKEQRAA